MSIARSGTPYQNRVTASTTTTVTIPSGAAVGALGVIYAFSSLTGSWGTTPSGWTVVPNSTQTATAPSCIAYYKILTAADLGANVTITAQGSATMVIGGFAYTGTQGFDVNNNQHNASSTTCTAPAVTATGLADMLVMIAGVTPTGTFTVASSGGNGLTLWVGASSSGIADKQLSASGSTSTSAMTISGAAANDGITLTLFQLDSDGGSVTSKAPGRSRILPFSRMSLLATGQDEQVYVAPALDDAPIAGQAGGFGTSALMRQLNRAALWRNPGLDEQHLPAVGDDAQIAGQIAGPGTGLLMRAWNRAARPRPMFEETAFAAPIIDEDIGRPAVKYLPRFRQSRGGDEQQSLVTPPPDERTVARVSRLRAFRARTQSVDDSRTIVDDDAPRRRARLTRLRVPASLAPGAERHAPVLAEEAFSPPLRRWHRFRRWVRQVAEDSGLIIPSAPSFRFAATLDLSLIFPAATLDSTAVFNATLNPPIIFGATLG